MVTKRATIHWATKEQGGRTAPPSGPRYSAPATFIAAPERALSEQWSLVVDLVARRNSAYDWIADVHFLVPEAPQHWLRDGAEFELYEGRKCVAHGQIEIAEAPAPYEDMTKTPPRLATASK